MQVCVCGVTGSAGQNKQHLVTKNTAKLDRETEELHHERVTLEVGKVIQKGRQDKGLTQKDLATVRIHTQTIHCSEVQTQTHCIHTSMQTLIHITLL